MCYAQSRAVLGLYKVTDSKAKERISKSKMTRGKRYIRVLLIFIVLALISVAAGLCEVLLSPLVAALPSDNPERDMSKLHSVYAWGVVAVIILSTLFLTYLLGFQGFALIFSVQSSQLLQKLLNCGLRISVLQNHCSHKLFL